MALTMISIEAGLFTFIYKFYPENILEEGNKFITVTLGEWSSLSIPIFESMILILIISLFAFTFSFAFFQTTIFIHATGQDSAYELKTVKSFLDKGITLFKLGFCLLLAFISIIIYHIHLSLLYIYILLYIVFIISLLLPLRDK